MEKICDLCQKNLKEDDDYQFFPEDDSYICRDCLQKSSGTKAQNEENLESNRENKTSCEK
ncbi:MAG: hypothetical protein ABIJ15_08135 [bacterium]